MIIKITFVAILTLINGATIAELLAQDSRLSQVAAKTPQNPAWSSAGRITVFAPTNEAIASASLSGNVGAVTSNQVT